MHLELGKNLVQWEPQFSGAEDGFIMANMYELITADTLTSVTIGLRIENNLTLPGGEVMVHIYDTTGLSQGYGPTYLFSSDFYQITENDTLNGFKTMGLDGDGYILNSGAYLIAVELYSNGNNNPITILDDKTVIRNPWSSCIYIPGDQWYTNGEAFYISANFGGDNNSNSNSDPIISSIYPNEFYSNSGYQTFNITFQNINFELGIGEFSAALFSDFSYYGIDNIQFVSIVDDSTMMFETYIWDEGTFPTGFYNGWNISFNQYDLTNLISSVSINNFIDLSIVNPSIPGITILSEPINPSFDISPNEGFQGESLQVYISGNDGAQFYDYSNAETVPEFRFTLIYRNILWECLELWI